MQIEQSYIEVAVAAAREAGSLLKDFVGKLRRVETKQGQSNNLVTEADRASEEAIVSIILRHFPDHAILGEEGGARNGRSECRWIIDPLDGTTNFTHGLPIYSVSIGVERLGEIVAGVVYDPSRDELFSAERGAGAFLNGAPLQVTDADDLDRSLLVTGFPYNLRENPDRCQERFLAFLNRAQAVRRLGSAALDCAYVAAGRFDGFWEVNLHPWDKAAGALLIEEAGGVVTDFEGRPHDLYKPPFLGSNGRIHEQMIEVLRGVGSGE